MIHRRWLHSGGNAGTYLLFCPSLTIVALAASSMLQAHRPPEQAAWVVLTGLFITTSAVLAFALAAAATERSRFEIRNEPLAETPAPE